MKNLFFKPVLIFCFFFAFTSANAQYDERDSIAIDSCLRILSIALTEASVNESVASYYYTCLGYCVDGYYRIGYSEFIERYDSLYSETGLLAMLDTSISQYLSTIETGSEYYGQTVNQILEVLQVQYELVPGIVFPSFDAFRYDVDILTYTPNLGYYSSQDEWPLPCINCGEPTIDKQTVEANVTWFVNLYPTSVSAFHDLERIAHTQAFKKSFKGGIDCEICYPLSPAALTNAGNGQGTQDHEFRVGNFSDSWVGGGHDACHFLIPFTNPLINVSYATGNYALISKVIGFDYWSLYTSGAYKKIKKQNFPIVDFQYYKNPVNNQFEISRYGEEMTLVGVGNFDFETFTYPTQEKQRRYSNAYGALYKLSRPGVVGSQPVYISYPYGKTIWYNSDPDMTVNIDTWADDSYPTNPPMCAPANIRYEYEETNSVTACPMCNNNAAIMSTLSGDILDYLVSTDYSFMYDFWSDNVITIGLSAGSGLPAENNIYNFYASSSPVSSCSIPSGDVEIENFELESDGEYEIADTFTQIAQGTTLYITVVANFDNTEYINETRCITVGNNSEGYINHAMVQIRGNLKDYSSTTVNYSVSIKYVPFP